MARFDRLFKPKSIAVIGGGAWCSSVISRCQEIGFSGQIWSVHPTKKQISGLIPYRSVSDLPAAPDAVFIGVNRNLTVNMVAELSAIDAGGAVCFASGFLEAQQEDTTGADHQSRLIAAAGDMPILGPNCYGFLNYLDGATLWPDHHGGERVERGVAIVTQSSNIALNLTMQRRGLPLAYVVTAGNQAQAGLSQIGIALLEDPRVSALGLHIEGVGDLRDFEELAQAAHRLGKPIVAIKAGKSEQARSAAVSHTASLAGSNAGATALFARLGIGQVQSLSALLETLKLLHVAGPLVSANIASLSCSGGEASLLADAAVGTGVRFPQLTRSQSHGLRLALGPMVALANPLDYHTYIWGDQGGLNETFAAMMHPGLGLGIVVVDFPRADRCDAAEWELVINAAMHAQAAGGVPIALLGSITENMPEETAKRLVALGITPLCGIEEAMVAVEIAAQIGAGVTPVEPLFLAPETHVSTALTEAEAKTELAKAGVAVPLHARANSESGAAEAARRLGFPVALKGEGFAHKTEAGAVLLNLRNASTVLEAAKSMKCTSFLVEKMVEGHVSELLVGAVRDPAHGFVLTLAAGGELTEILQDSVSLLVPASREIVKDALLRLRIAPVLTGYRGKPGVDMKALVDSVMAIQKYVQTHAPQEVEVNPLLCGPDFAIAADALIRTGVSDDR